MLPTVWGMSTPPVRHPPSSFGRARGKFIYANDQKLYLRGVTYGTFRATANGQFPPPAVVAADFAAMAAAGVNTVRTYTVPTPEVLELAGLHGLRLLVGIPWEQHVAFMDERSRPRSIEARVRDAVRSCTGHSAVLGYVVGNEIPAGVVRWHGRQRVERFIERLYRAAKAEDPGALVTYANFPSTEYLHLPFLDLVCFNVFLEDEARLAAYIARLQTIAGDRPLVISELGLDSARHGLETQAESAAAQIRTTYAGGCAGCFVFAWTDEWNRGAHEVTDWDFGLVDRARRPKPALAAARAALEAAPFPAGGRWPTASVVVCTYNGSRTIAECVQALLDLDYPHYEVIVVDDGSSDGAGELAAAQGAHVRVIHTANRGLSAARNVGIQASQAEIVAFCDDDCRADRHWLRYLVSSLVKSTHVGVGGPNIPPPDRVVADAVGHAP